MEDYLNLSFDDFLVSVAGTENYFELYMGLKNKPSNSKLRSIEIYNYLEKISSNFNAHKTEIILKEIDLYLIELNESYAMNYQIYKARYPNRDQENQVNAFKIEQFVDTISLLEDKLKRTIKQSEINRFETTLTDVGRMELCDKIIAESASDKPNYKKTFIGSIDKPTLMYLLGGERPYKIKKIRMAASHQNIYNLLFGVSSHTFNDEKCLPGFVKSKICPEILLDKDGKSILKLNNDTVKR